MTPTPRFTRFRRIVTTHDDAGRAAFTARRRERARLVVEDRVQIGRFEREGGRDAAVRALMGSSMRALIGAV